MPTRTKTQLKIGYKLALQAGLCYNKALPMFCIGATANSPMRELYLCERQAYGHSIFILPTMQADPPSFPLLNWRKAIMPVPKDPQKREEYLRKQSESHKGQETSEELRARRSELMRQRREDPVYLEKLMNGIKNRKMTEGYRQKLSDAAKKRGVSEATRQASIQSRKDHGISEEHRKKMSDANKGNTNGSKLSQESRNRRSEQCRTNPPRRGYKMAEDERVQQTQRIRSYAHKISASVKASWDRLSEEERNARIEQTLDAVSIHPSSLEILVSQELDALHIAYQRQYRIGRYVVDFYISNWNTIIEVKGCYWHGCGACGYEYPYKQEKDRIREGVITSKGYTFIDIWEHSIICDLQQAVQDAISIARKRFYG